MKRVLTGIAVGAMALGVVSFTPDTASAKRSYGWGGWDGGPGVSIHIGPRQGYAPRYKYRNYGYRQNRHWRSPTPTDRATVTDLAGSPARTATTTSS